MSRSESMGFIASVMMGERVGGQEDTYLLRRVVDLKATFRVLREKRDLWGTTETCKFA